MTTIERISLLKDQQKLSDAKFERLLELKEKTFYNWKAGRSKTYNNMLPKIADVLRTTTAYLLGEIDNPAPSDTVIAASTKPNVENMSTSDLVKFISQATKELEKRAGE